MGREVGGDGFMDRRAIIDYAKSELAKTGLGNRGRYGVLISGMFDLSSHYDMAMKIELFDHSARLYTCERGKCVYEYRTGKVAEIVFFILDDVIRMTAHSLTVEKFQDENRSLRYGEEVREYEKSLVRRAFEAIGGQFLEWHERGRKALNM